MILLDPIWYLLIQLDPIWFNLIWFELICSYLIWFDPVWSNLFQSISFNSLWSDLNQFEPTWFVPTWPNNQFDSSWSILIQFEPVWTNLIMLICSTGNSKRLNSWVLSFFNENLVEMPLWFPKMGREIWFKFLNLTLNLPANFWKLLIWQTEKLSTWLLSSGQDFGKKSIVSKHILKVYSKPSRKNPDF